jgi:hypothetical protein
MRIPMLVVSPLVACALAAPGASAQTLSRPADGFALAIPSGWQEEPGADNVISQAGDTGLAAMVIVQREKAPSGVTDVLARVSTKMKADTSRKVIWSKFDVFMDRPALVAEIEDDASRFRITAIPRDTGDTSQIFYVIMTLAPKAAFSRAAASLDRVRDGFRITAIGKAAPAPKPRPAGAVSLSERRKYFERILTPPKPGG